MTVQSGRGGRTSVVIDPTEAHDRPAESTAGARGAKQTLDARLHQARAGELGHLEFLQVLCLDEISRRETTAIARRTRRARFEQTATLEGFDFTANRSSRPRRSGIWPRCAGSRPVSR